MIQACLFDLDGTLQDSEILWVEATRAFLFDEGVTLTHDETQKIVYGRGWSEVYAAMVRHAAALDERGKTRVANELRLYYQRLRDTTNIALPGSIDLLRRLAETLPVAIVSGSTRHDIQEAIEHLAIGDSVQFYVGAEDYGPGKPSPDCFLLAAARLKLAPANCLVFEDSTAGVLAAKRAGMRCVAIACPGRPKQDLRAADLICEDLGSLTLAELENLP